MSEAVTFEIANGEPIEDYRVESVKKERKVSFSEFLTSPRSRASIKNALSDDKRCERFVASLVSVVSSNSELESCTPVSILKSALLAESLGLSLSPQIGQCYLMPFQNNKKKCKEAQFSMSYRGMIQLALRSGQYKRLNVFAVKKGELESWNPITEDVRINFIVDDEGRELEKTTGYVAFFEYLNGFKKTIYWSRAKMEAHAKKYSKAYARRDGSSFWEKDFDAMAFKTMLRQLIGKWGILSVDMQTALEQDASSNDSAGYIESAGIQADEVKRVSIQNV